MSADKARLAAASVLDAAADLLEPHGAWCQRVGARLGPGGVEQRCAATAINVAALSATRSGAPETAGVWARIILQTSIRRTLPAWDIESWNDTRSRTKAQVIAAMREAARHERERQGV